MLPHLTTAGVIGVPVPPAASSVGPCCLAAMPAAITGLLCVTHTVLLSLVVKRDLLRHMMSARTSNTASQQLHY